MITKEIALSLNIGQTLFHLSRKTSDGSRVRARVNGKVKTWKTKPNDFRIPMKYGFNSCFYIGNKEYSGWANPNDWTTEDN